ncbi:sugar ABC transporter permease [Alsobacter sp. SYSU M60028]|uniref:Sugar ABC transporter permease n=1 Tax=Alsobacter ponti TaxID=2962936 RepID=A0ABT1L689_9HYPH|nr:sugar ABC transporter permease [Alsobacter ponti]MCP8936899.1 sugar ABC transporter permease [Alsobacter ponti]
MAFAIRPLSRSTADRVLFLGPAVALLAMFFLVPAIIDVAIAFTDMGRNLRVSEYTTQNVARMLGGDSRLTGIMAVTLTYVLATLAIFNVGYGLLLALLTTALPDRAGAFFRAVWILPRMSPSVVYALLWTWVVAPTEYGLLNQVLAGLGFPAVDPKSNAPMLVIVLANGFIGASFGMIIFTSAIRSIPEHLFHAARVDGAGELAIVRHVTLPAIRWQLSFVTIYQALSLMVSFEYIWLITNGGPFFDTTVYALYVYRRAFENGQYAYGAALALGLVVVGMIMAMVMWRFFDMRALLQRPRIEARR